jgi:phosphatidylinositol alpha-mannosyltransferase
LLQAKIHAYSLDDCVSLTGFVDEVDKADYLASADVAVYPATGGEAFGIVLLEAMSAGAFVLAGDNPGYSAALAGSEGMLFHPQDYENFANRIRLALDDQALRRRVLAWQQLAMKRYDIEAVGPQLADLYLEATRSAA